MRKTSLNISKEYTHREKLHPKLFIPTYPAEKCLSNNFKADSRVDLRASKM
jgi:hypothetical protein